jgi:predicted  nucleic acid-binding Zn ribbon protein
MTASQKFEVTRISHMGQLAIADKKKYLGLTLSKTMNEMAQETVKWFKEWRDIDVLKANMVRIRLTLILEISDADKEDWAL